MARLTLLIGPAGCGKTHRVLSEAAKCALAGPLPTETLPPLLVIVPEQQAAGTERALLTRIAELSGHGDPATARLRVMSLSRLARVLAGAGGRAITPLGDLGRRLLIWRLLEGGDEPSRRARAEALSDAMAELALYGTAPEDLEDRASELEAGGDAGLSIGANLAQKLRELALVTRACNSECDARGLDHTPAAAQLSELLNESNWPHLAVTRVWVDGFAGFTPAEESALLALLRSCASVTATVMIDPAKKDAPGENDTVDWYAPTRTTLRRWRALAGSAPAAIETIELGQTGLPRWDQGSPLATLANPAEATAPEFPVTDQASAVVLPNERAEVDYAARTILDLVNNRSYRFNEISVVARSLEPYADLIATRFLEHGIPCYLDRRESVAQHPLVEQLRCGLRLGLGQANDDDVYTLLKAGLLCPDTDETTWTAAELRDRADRLENYARAHGLRPGHWLRDRPWEWRERLTRRDGDDPGRAARHEKQAIAATTELDGWRRELLAPVIRLRQGVREGGQPLVGTVLAAAWEHLAGQPVQAVLESWAAAAETAASPGKAKAAVHRGIAALLAKLIDELNALAGDIPLGRGGISAAELCTWIEYGLSALSLGQPPLNLDSVLVTEVERGRHHPLKATLLLGLAEDTWPPPAQETALFSDAERAAINAAQGADLTGRGLTGPGSTERGEREPYLALVALTRAAQYLQLSRPGADTKGGARPSSMYFKHCCTRLGIKPTHPAVDALTAAATPLDIACWAGANTAPAAIGDLLSGLGDAAGPARDALSWGQGYSGSSTGLMPLDRDTMATLVAADDDGRLVLRGSTSRLEAFAACPFKHFASYFLGLRERREALFDTRTLGSLYHEVLQLTIEALNRDGYAWPGRPREVYDRSLAILEQTIATLSEETGRERTAHLRERARLILWHQANGLCESLAEFGRSPRATELRIGGSGDAALPPLILEDETLRLELGGFIDRLDDGADGITVVDYKFKGGEVRWEQFLAGTQVQLFAYLLAAGEARRVDGDTDPPLAAVEYQPIEINWDGGTARLSARREPHISKTEKHPEKYDQLLTRSLAEVRRIMLELSSRLLGGETAPLPLSWKGGKQTACGFCDYREACRFDPQGGERYREVLTDRNNVLRDRINDGADFTGSALATGAPAREVTND